MEPSNPQGARERMALSFFTADDLGRIVREAWTEYARLAGDTKPEHLVSWEYLSEYDREADRRIGLAVCDAINCHLADESEREERNRPAQPSAASPTARPRSLQDITTVELDRAAEQAKRAINGDGFDFSAERLLEYVLILRGLKDAQPPAVASAEADVAGWNPALVLRKQAAKTKEEAIALLAAYRQRPPVAAHCLTCNDTGVVGPDGGNPDRCPCYEAGLEKGKPVPATGGQDVRFVRHAEGGIVAELNQDARREDWRLTDDDLADTNAFRPRDNSLGLEIARAGADAQLAKVWPLVEQLQQQVKEAQDDLNLQAGYATRRYDGMVECKDRRIAELEAALDEARASLVDAPDVNPEAAMAAVKQINVLLGGER